MPILLLRCLGLFENSFPPSDLRGTYGGFLKAADEKAIFKHTLVRGPWGEGDKERRYKDEKLKNWEKADCYIWNHHRIVYNDSSIGYRGA